MPEAAVSLGRFFGIPVKIHWSWLIVFALVTWSLAANYFPPSYPGWSTEAYWIIGIVTSLLFFGSVLLHELAHSWVARGAGIPVDSITLFVFGGVSRIAREPGRPRVEFRMALAGPATSLALSLIFGAIWLAARSSSEPLAGLTFWLAWINLVLAGFNLIPGFPLDGGRVLRSILWWRTGNLRKATRAASAIGRGVGYLFIFGGVLMIFWGYWANGISLAIVGWFLENAAVGSYRQVALQDMLRGHTVSEVMTRGCPAVSPKLTIERLVHEYILGLGRRCFPVVEDGRVLGLVTLHNVKALGREAWPTTMVAEAMVPFDKVKWVRPGEDLSSVLHLLADGDVNQVPVVENGNIVGMVARDNWLFFIHTRAELGI